MWLIDPYWTILPPIYGFIWAFHPLAVFESRTIVGLVLVIIWSLRLTHSYFRREEWKFGEREDWRYTKMALDYGKCWYALSFLTVGIAQHPMIVGISLPLWSNCFGPHAEVKWFWLDYVATILGLSGIITAYVADNQLRDFMMENEKLKEEGKPKNPILNTGLWRYSRHPNYFGEQLWWWSFSLFSVSVGAPWCIAGTAFNSLVLAIVTCMTEDKMLREWPEDRANLFREYQRTTSALIPWCPKEAP